MLGIVPLVAGNISRTNIFYHHCQGVKTRTLSFPGCTKKSISNFAPFDFSTIPDFPNLVPHIDEWEGHLLRFKDEKEDSHAEHLL